MPSLEENLRPAPLWDWSEACAAVGVPVVAGPDISGISIDTRSLQPGDLFIALKGDPGPRFHTASRTDRDGHDYVAEAARKGAAGALVHRPVPVAMPQLLTRDSLDGLWDLGRAARQRCQGRIFAVTGSSGKTTVKAFLGAALGCPPSSGSLNNFWGVPLSLARTPAQAPAAVFEIGTNHPGEIAPLSELVQPQVALVLNVLPAHLAQFANLAALRTEKLSIAQGLVPGGKLVVAEELAAFAPVPEDRLLRFGTGPDVQVQLLEYDPARREARYRCLDTEYLARVPGGGQHRALSLAAVLACLVAAEQDPALACTLDDELIPAGRGRILYQGGVSLIDDSYNANPASMAAALTSLQPQRPGRAFAILGEMLELGDASAAYHAELAAACTHLDGIWCVGPGMQVLDQALPPSLRQGWVAEQSQLDLDRLCRHLQPGDQVLIKGSNLVFWAHGFVTRLAAKLAERP